MRTRWTAALILVLGASLLVAVRGWGEAAKTFPHDTHIAQGLDCATCHAGATESENLKTGLLPPLTTCQQCHEQTELDSWGFHANPTRKTGFPGFSHKAHLAQGKDCLACHGAMVHPEQAAAGTGMPNHALCFECHDGTKATDECESCHAGLHESRLNGLLRDPAAFKPIDHHPGFVRNHQFQSELVGTRCESCHPSENYCAGCHQGDNVDFLVHDRNWLQTHPLSAGKDLVECQTCHSLNTFCSDCHETEGVEPGSHLAGEWAGGVNLHAQMGRRDMEYCASCHDVEALFICSRCHHDDGIQGNQPSLNIHPPSFRVDASHGYWHEDTAAACFQCHDPGPRERGVGFCGYCHGAGD
jgi:hypothetical protein